MSREPDAASEPDRLDGTPHPRERAVLFGHRDGEGAFLEGLRSGRLHHAWLIGGPEGIGKATLAYRAARRLLSLKASDDPRRVEGLDLDPQHPVARQVSALSHPNLTVLRRMAGTDKKAASATIPVESVRRALSLFGSTAADGGYRVCIVDSAEDLTVSSANALLKLVEEPPPRSVFLIVSHAPQRVLPTIRSRCRRLLLRPLDEADVRAVLRSLGPPWDGTDETVLRKAIALGEGSVRRTLEMLDGQALALVDTVTGLLETLPRLDLKRVLALSEQLARKDAEDAYALTLETVQRWVTERLHQEAQSGAARLAPLVEVCENMARSAREVDVFNLDRRPLVLALFDDLAEAVRRTGPVRQTEAVGKSEPVGPSA